MKKFTILAVGLLPTAALFGSAHAGKNRAPHNNIYYFGDSRNDTGNLKTLRPDLAVDSNTPLPNGQVIKVRFNETGRNSNGLVRVDLIAENCGYKLYTASKLKCLPKGNDNFVNFAISGASQNNNSGLYTARETPSLSIRFR